MDTNRLVIIARRVQAVLERYREPYGLVIGQLITKFVHESDLLKKSIRQLFGAMGSLNDIYISKDNGHQVNREEETNLELTAYLNVLWEEVKDPAIDQIPHPALYLVKTFPVSHEEAEDALSGSNLESIFDVLVWITYYGHDWRWVQDKCLALAKNDNPEIRGLAAACLADLAQLHGCLDLGKVVPCLTQLSEDPEVQERAGIALRVVKGSLAS